MKKIVIPKTTIDAMNAARPLSQAQKAYVNKCMLDSLVGSSKSSRWLSRKQFVTLKLKNSLIFVETVDEFLGDRIEAWLMQGICWLFIQHDLYENEYRII